MVARKMLPLSRRTRRVAWLLGIWAASVATMAAVAYVLRVIMNWVGMTA